MSNVPATKKTAAAKMETAVQLQFCRAPLSTSGRPWTPGVQALALALLLEPLALAPIWVRLCTGSGPSSSPPSAGLSSGSCPAWANSSSAPFNWIKQSVSLVALGCQVLSIVLGKCSENCDCDGSGLSSTPLTPPPTSSGDKPCNDSPSPTSSSPSPGSNIIVNILGLANTDLNLGAGWSHQWPFWQL
ncbi:hypothetical protein BDP27DRAFT_1415652 [Rhodocollybia butyracea]|uniref:Uncharacterized protein n=1 Tax=Rhodocollybia butyracea TaxID=206335 RepID=A0A9P5Q4I5_9AGAR|nr:hypothetical protein BDP27DRAFT_1415652 [Rhodocollybia butyracea]